MLRRMLTTAAGIALSAAPSALRADTDAAAVKDLLKESSSVTSAERELSAAAKEKLGAALGDDFRPDTDGKVALWTAKGLANPLGDPEKLDMAWAVVAKSGDARVAVIAFRDATSQNRLTIASATLLAPADPPEKMKKFMGRLGWRYVAANAYEPLSVLESRRAAAKAGADDAAKQASLLLSLLHDMHEVEDKQEAIGAAADAKDAAAAQAAAAGLAKEFEEAKEAFEKSDFVLGAKASKEKPILLKNVDKALAGAQAAAAAAEAKNFEGAAQRADDIACEKCHSSFRKYFEDKRAELKIGDGYFQLGHDLRHVDGDAAPLARAAAAATRKALLIIDQLTQ